MTQVEKVTAPVIGNGMLEKRGMVKVNFGVRKGSVQSIGIALHLLFGAAFATDAGALLVPTMSYDRAVPIKANNEVINTKNHSAPRCYDWDHDGDLDLLVGGGDGRLWVYRNAGTAQQPVFQAKEPILAGGCVNWGRTYTGVAMIDLVGNELPDLVVGHSDNAVTVHANIGTIKEPRFAESGVTFQVQKNCQGRFDVADWDGDGLADLVTGSFGGKVEWHRNSGNRNDPKFGPGEPFFDLSLAYNSHPRILDFNQDGQLDLLLGVNWGTASLYLHEEANGKSSLSASRLLQWSDGKSLNIRDLNGDDTTPELADFDGDGVLDLISGGKNGRLFFMRGIGFPSRVESFKTLLSRHEENFGKALRDNLSVQQEAFGALASLQADLASGLIPLASREQLFQQLAPLAQQYPDLLGRSKVNLESSPELPLLAGQYWVVLLESLPDSPSNRQRVADALDFQGGYERLLVDLGVLLIDNDTATPEHLEAMHELMMAMPRAVWDVETITVAGWLGPAIKTQKIRSRSGINIFDLPLGRTENSFPNDSPRPGITDVYLICLAHELAHNMLDTVGRKIRPELYERKFAGLAQSAGEHVVYRSPRSGGIDLAATKDKFRSIGAWDGAAATWNDAWVNYFKGKEEFEKAYTRGNVQFFLDAPQEAFATLANQYFADSQLMLEFCKARWDSGHRSNINQFLLIADYLSEGTTNVNFYVMRPGGDLTVTPVKLARDDRGRISQVQSKNSVASFDYDDANLATEFQLESIAK